MGVQTSPVLLIDVYIILTSPVCRHIARVWRPPFVDGRGAPPLLL